MNTETQNESQAEPHGQWTRAQIAASILAQVEVLSCEEHLKKAAKNLRSMGRNLDELLSYPLTDEHKKLARKAIKKQAKDMSGTLLLLADNLNMVQDFIKKSREGGVKL